MTVINLSTVLVLFLGTANICWTLPIPDSQRARDVRKRGTPVAHPVTIMRIRKQDAAVQALGVYRDVPIYADVKPGPEDNYLRIAGLPSVGYSPAPGSFLYDPVTHTQQFDAVHCFAVVRNIVTMFQQALNALPSQYVTQTFQWQWGSGTPLTIVPRFREEHENPFTLNAIYQRSTKRISFDVWVVPPGGANAKRVYLSQSYDIVAHEAAHAILDGLKPLYLLWAFSHGHIESAALHESFADLTVILSLFWQFDVVEAIMVESRGGETLRQGFWNILGEHFGKDVFRRDPATQGIRNLNNSLTVEDIPKGAYDGFGVVFTSSIFDSIVDIFELERDASIDSPAATLYYIGQDFLDVILKAFISMKVTLTTPTSLEKMAYEILGHTKIKDRKDILRHNFEQRLIIANKRNKNKKKKTMPPSFCRTLRKSNEN